LFLRLLTLILKNGLEFVKFIMEKCTIVKDMRYSIVHQASLLEKIESLWWKEKMINSRCRWYGHLELLA
jgi:hypothetical protein